MSNTSLEQVHKASQPLITNAIETQEEVEDFIRALRFIMRSNGDAGAFMLGFEKLLIYQENLQRIAVSYHQAVGESIKEAV